MTQRKITFQQDAVFQIIVNKLSFYVRLCTHLAELNFEFERT